MNLDGPAITHRLLTTNVTTKALAVELGVSRRHIEAAYALHSTPEERLRAAYRKCADVRRGQKRTGIPRFDWGSVDWTRNDSDIARRLGCSVAAVQHSRKRLGKPDSPVKRRHEYTVQRLGLKPAARERREREIARRLIETDATCQSLGHEFGLCAVTILNICKKHTTKEQRREVRRRKIAAAHAENPSGWHAKLVAKAARNEVAELPGVVRLVRECASCGADVRTGSDRCPKCGSGQFVKYDRSVITTKRQTPKTAAQRIDAFLQTLEAVGGAA